MYSYYIYTAFMLVIVILCIRQRDIRKQNGLSGRIKCILDTNLKTKLYMLFVCVCLISMAVVLVYVFPENTINRNIRSITITSILMIAAYYDYKEFRIPNKLIIPGIVVWIGITLFEMATCKDVWLANLITEIIVSLAFLIVCVLCAVIVKNGIGMGDIKLLMLMGLIEGIDGAVSSVFVSMIVIFIVAIIMFIAQKKSKKDMLPFAPYILMGTVLSIFTSGY